jgi:16S rRNA (adenine1518-N6/adenine1519-N6)-dimethyltransferase
VTTQHRPKKSLGQNFLRDKAFITRIVDALDLTSDDRVIEIGPGEGALTDRLVASGASVTAIEFDRELVPRLRERFADRDNFVVVEADALDVDFAGFRFGDGSLKLAANLPYNISTPILQRLVGQREVFSRLVLMFQREVVERIAAEPGGRERGYLSVVAQNAFEIEPLFDVPPGAFYPVPKVWSSVVRFTPKPLERGEREFSELVSTAFRQKRKTILNNLSPTYALAGEALQRAGVDPRRRAETLTIQEWHLLAEHIQKSREA